MPPHVLIAGAGIGGLTASLTMARVGLDVSILERAHELEEVGAGLQLSPNASRILRDLGLLEAVVDIATAPKGIRVRAAGSASTLSFLPLRQAEARWGAPYLVVHRADLQRVLMAAVSNVPSVALHLGTALVGFGVRDDRVTVAARQGLLSRTHEADVLVGADGIRSSVRAKLADASDHPLEMGRTAWRTIVAADDVDAMFAAPETGLWLGRDAHLVHYPLRGGRLVNVVAITRDGLAPRKKSAEPASLWSAPGDPALVASRFARWHGAARKLIAAAPGWTTWPLSDRKPLPAFSVGRIALLGDAAHPILPFFAQGAAQAIEDAAALAGALAATSDATAALAAYSRARLPRATRVQEASRQLGRIYHMSGPMALARDAAMRVLGPDRLMARYDWLYGA